MTLYYSLLKAFLDGSLYKKYKNVLDGEFIKENYPELFKLFQCLALLHSQQPDDQVFSLQDLEVSLETYYPNSDRASYTAIFRQLSETTSDPNTILVYLEQVKKRQLASDLAHISLAVAEGRKDWTAIKEVTDAAEKDITSLISVKPNIFVDDDLETLLQTHRHTKGLRWRLNSLNTSLGSLRKGDFGFLFARPESGKTTLLASEVSYMAEQATGPVIWFNNEEQGGKVVLRCYQASLGLLQPQLDIDPAGNKQKYWANTKRNIKVIHDADGGITKSFVEEVCKEHQPALIIFDQIDQIHGFTADRDDIELKQKYIWARELAKQFGPVIAVCQAGGSGDGKRWLTMNDVDNSKTGKQSAADWILGIGKDYDEGHEFVRYMYLSKNKLVGDDDTIPNRRHDRWEVKFRPDIARYEDF